MVRIDDDSPPPAATVALRRNRNFRLLWVGQVLSDLGSEFGALAYPLLVLALTHSAVVAGAVGTSAAVAAFAVRLPAGALADRLDRRRTMVIADGVRTLVLAAMGVAVLFHEITWPVVLVVAVIDRVGDTIFSPSSTTAMSLVVHDTQLESAWAATEARQYAASLGGPALGGLLFGLARSLPFFGDAVSYGVSTLTSSMMTGSFAPAPARSDRRGLWHEAFEGVRLMWRDGFLRAVMIQSPLINFAFTGVIFSVTLALRQHGTSASVIGLTQAGIGAGGLLGAIVAPKLQGRLTISHLVVAITGAGTLLLGTAALLVPSPLVALPIGATLLLAPAANAALFGALLRRTPEELRGRVNNSLIQVASGLATLAPFIAGVLVDDLGAHWAMGLFSMVLGVSTVMALSLSGMRLVDQESPLGPSAAG